MNTPEFNVTSRKFIKPSSQTPHPKIFTLSLLDQHYPPYYGATLFFYHRGRRQTITISDSLQKSLSDVLIHYYPLAGRLNSTSSIECNDQGAYFVEAEIGCNLVDFLEKPDCNDMDIFYPIKNDPLARNSASLVQLTLFRCGGACICVCTLHKLFDASSLCTFMKCWSDLSNGIGKVTPPKFTGSSLLPPTEFLIFPVTERPTEKCTIRRFVFDASKISNLKDFTTNDTRGVSSVGLTMALILKCAISASRSKLGFSTPALSLYMVDLRKRMDPPLSEDSLGNLAWGLPVLIEENESKVLDLVAKMRRVLREFYKTKASRFNGDSQFVVESFKERMKLSEKIGNKISYVGSSLCGYPLYEMDFGWGKPIWSLCKSNYRNSIFLLDNKMGNAIEAWVTLDEQEMAFFERDPELLAFASLNPSASFTVGSRM